MKRTVLHIDRLVLHGFRPEDRHGIAAGLQLELGRIFSDPQAVRQLTSTGHMYRIQIGGTGSARIAPGAGPRSIGTQVARGIGKGLSK